jgi:hypothetical protein
MKRYKRPNELTLLKGSAIGAERAEAREILERVYAGFTEGFGTLDLVNAREMLA